MRTLTGALIWAIFAPVAAAQSFYTWQSLWGPGRKSSGELFQSAATPLPPGPFRTGGDGWQLSFGAQYFARMESRDNGDFSAAADDRDSFVEHRARVTFRGSVQDRVGFVLEYQDVRVWGAERSPVVTEPFTGLHQGYADLRAASWLDLRVGRQELSYGEDRLLGFLDWAMSARAFDGVFLRFRPADAVTLDAFAYLVRERSLLTGPDQTTLPNEGAELYGVYGRWRPSPKWGLDLYALGLVRDPTTLETGRRGSRGLATLGGRGFVTAGPLSASAEAAFQLGSDLAGDVRAWALAVKAAYTLPVWGSPYLGVEVLRASGDGDPTDGTSRTFNQLFPTAHLFLGYADYVGWQNVQGYRATVGLRPWGAHVWVDFHRMEMVEPRGAWFNAAGNVFLAADPLRTDGLMGHELDVSFTLPLWGHVAVAGAYALFLPGGAAGRAPGSQVGKAARDASHWGFLYLRTQL